MKIMNFTTLILWLTVTGCQQSQATFDIEEVTISLEKSEIILGTYIEKLNSEFTLQDVRAQIVCKDYPREYTKNYIPNMLKLNSEYTELDLLQDMNSTLDHYKSNDNIQC